MKCFDILFTFSKNSIVARVVWSMGDCDAISRANFKSSCFSWNKRKKLLRKWKNFQLCKLLRKHWKVVGKFFSWRRKLSNWFPWNVSRFRKSTHKFFNSTSNWIFRLNFFESRISAWDEIRKFTSLSREPKLRLAEPIFALSNPRLHLRRQFPNNKSSLFAPNLTFSPQS